MSDPGRKLVLVADDDPDILDLVTFRLDRAGYEVVQARDGQEALDAALARTPDLCVLDVMMPLLDGYEVTRRLRGPRRPDRCRSSCSPRGCRSRMSSADSKRARRTT